METVNYRKRHSFIKYDNNHFLLYLNEKPVTFTIQGEENEIEGYSYTGDEIDGSTSISIDVYSVTDENRRGKFVAGLIAKRYSIDDQIAILANRDDTDEHAEELHTFEAYRAECKRQVDELLNR